MSTRRTSAKKQKSETQEKWLTPAEVARLRGVSRAAVYKAVEQGRLPHEIVLGRIALREADVKAWVDTGARAGRPKGIPMSEKTKAVVAEAQRRRWGKRE